MLRDLKSKVTGRIFFGIDEETYQQMVEQGTAKKFIVIQEHVKKNVIPDELIIKTTKVTKRTEEKTLKQKDES